ncbi:FAD:protein FMN transferase [Rhodococcus triatomae]|uniref:FAD:protein FMN transferase n=1 Tax=Rhodococcus triatomae TaxID=300028 RepID=A0A1G8AFX0_9NOCA|nr:FAD:protein FMN transferase [Rhodococcus triatomae]QNG17780.1 FAD:protein FMN transferase [Rhodococcus triatomae]QNG22552.1 FAD:protein FMN transferase [Rhodococcus triatomae]SDH19789.1 thiamine biosynthesis lipoprotein [Rhodococcus triatomae]
MVSVEKWTVWDSVVEVDVTEGAALADAAALLADVLEEVEATCDLTRGDAEIHTVNLSQGAPVRVGRRMAALLRSALWAARMTDGAVGPLAGDGLDGLDADDLHPIHPVPTYRDVSLDGDVLFAPWGASFDITATAKADTVDRAATLIANELECGAAVRIGDVIATAGHSPAGGWQMPVPGAEDVELRNGTALSTVTAASPPGALTGTDPASVPDGRHPTRWRQVSVVADDALWAYAASVAALAKGIAAVRWIDEHALRARLVDMRDREYTTENW